MLENAKKNYERLMGNTPNTLQDTDKEFVDYFTNFAFDETIEEDKLDETTRAMAILAVLIGNQGLDLFKRILTYAYNAKVTVIQMKEIAYQSVDYCGLGKAYPFIIAINDFCKENHIELPLEPRSTTTVETRLQKGNQVQIDCFGPRLKESWLNGPEERSTINKYLAGNCFGDVYTRIGLNDSQREMITFCFLIGQGGCEPQAIAHATANMNVGNSKEFLYTVVNHLVPYLGYPRSLNALSAIDTASK